MRVISLLFANHKGGVGKTTSVVALAREFARRGVNTLVVDSPDGHATYLFYANLLQPLLRAEGRRSQEGCRQPIRLPVPVFGAHCGVMDVACTNERYLAYLRASGLAESKLDWPELGRQYQVVLVDSPSHCDPFHSAHPFYQELTQEADVIIPTQADPLAVGGVRLTLEYLREAAQGRRPPRLCGVFVTMARSDEGAHAAVRELNALAPGKLFDTRIPYSAEVAQLKEAGHPPLARRKAEGLSNYEALASELISSLGLMSQRRRDPQRASWRRHRTTNGVK